MKGVPVGMYNHSRFVNNDRNIFYVECIHLEDIASCFGMRHQQSKPRLLVTGILFNKHQTEFVHLWPRHRGMYYKYSAVDMLSISIYGFYRFWIYINDVKIDILIHFFRPTSPNIAKNTKVGLYLSHPTLNTRMYISTWIQYILLYPVEKNRQ